MSKISDLVKIYRHAKKWYLPPISVTSVPVTSTFRKLKAKWSVELSKDLKAFHTPSAINQLQAEIDKETE